MAMLDCPVCGKEVDRQTAPTSVHEGITYYLRCPHCKERFDADPGRFLRSGPNANPGGCAAGGCHGPHARASGATRAPIDFPPLRRADR